MMGVAGFVSPLLLGVAALPLASPVTVAQVSRLSELPSVLVIAKSSNKNQVHYSAVVDETCTLVGPSPVRPYWRMLERGPAAVEPLSDRESRLLGIERQEVGRDGVAFSLRGMPAKVFTVHTFRASEGRCTSWIGTTIAGVQAHVTSVFAQQKFLGVDYVLLSGRSEEGADVSEKVSP
jgi:hypothetical protein